MKNTAFSGTVMILLLAGMLTLAFNIQPAKAQETIRIRADGSIDPPTAPITREGDIYTFTDNIYAEISIERSNMTMTGNGYTLQGPGSLSTGLEFRWCHNITIRNMEIKTFYTGIFSDGSSNITIVDNNIFDNHWDGIYATGTSNVTITGNNITRNRNGIYIHGSSVFNICGNNISNNSECGINQFSCSDITIANNNITSNEETGVNLSSPYYPPNNTILGNNITNNRDGIDLGSLSDNITISGNNIASNIETGIDLSGSSNETISKNNITNNNEGIHIPPSSNNNTIVENTIGDNNLYGIYLWSSSNNTIYRNTITNNTNGIYDNSGSSDNIIAGNNIANNTYGIYLYLSTNNSIYHNNFNHNTNHAAAYYCEDNTWDNGYPSGGNYWNDYTDLDENSGPNQDQPGSDYIWDHPYAINPDNQDHYPLVNKWSIADLNHDGAVNVLDAAAISAHWYPGPPIGPLGYNSSFDINNDGAIDVLDAALVSAYWTGPPKGPLAP